MFLYFALINHIFANVWFVEYESVGLLVIGMLFPPMHKPTENAIVSNTYTTPMLTSSFDRYS